MPGADKPVALVTARSPGRALTRCARSATSSRPVDRPPAPAPLRRGRAAGAHPGRGRQAVICEADNCKGPVLDLPLLAIGSTRVTPPTWTSPAPPSGHPPVLHAPAATPTAWPRSPWPALRREPAPARRRPHVRTGEIYRDGTIPTSASGRGSSPGTAGLVGLGAVGRATRWRLEGLGMQVIAHDPYNDEATLPRGAAGRGRRVSMHAMVKPRARDDGRGAVRGHEGGRDHVNSARATLHDLDALTAALRRATSPAPASTTSRGVPGDRPPVDRHGQRGAHAPHRWRHLRHRGQPLTSSPTTSSASWPASAPPTSQPGGPVVSEKSEKELPPDEEVFAAVLRAAKTPVRQGPGRGHLRQRVRAPARRQRGHDPVVAPLRPMVLEDLVVVDLDGEKVRARRSATTEKSLHLARYRAYDEVRGVIHAHPKHALDVRPRAPAHPRRGRGVRGLHRRRGAGVRLPHDRYRRARRGRGRSLADRSATLMANHGMVTVGKDVDDALHAAPWSSTTPTSCGGMHSARSSRSRRRQRQLRQRLRLHPPPAWGTTPGRRAGSAWVGPPSGAPWALTASWYSSAPGGGPLAPSPRCRRRAPP